MLKYFLAFLVASVLHARTHLLIEGDFLYLERTELHGHEVVTGGTNWSTESLVTRDFTYEPGYQVSALWMINRKNGLEVSGMNVEVWDAHKSISGVRDLNFPFDNRSFDPGFQNASLVTAHYQSQLWSIESNYWGIMTPRNENFFSVSWLIGLNYFNIKEKFNLAYMPVSQKNNYLVHSFNQVGIAQIGGDVQWNPTEHFSLELLAQVGGGVNWGSNRVFLGDVNNTIAVYDYHASDQIGAFYAGGVFSMAYQILRYFNLNLGYQFIFLNGLVLAPEQIDKSSNPASKQFEKHGKALYHGLIAGIGTQF